jgi:hypothetical protein
MLARTLVSPIRALTAAVGACAITGALAGPALAVPADASGPKNCACGGARVADLEKSGPSADLVRLHRSGIAVQSSSLGAGPAAGTRSPDSGDRHTEAAKRAQMTGPANERAQDLRSPDSVDRALAATQRAQTPAGSS